MPAPLPGHEAAQAAELPADQQEDANSDQAAQEYELLERVSLEQALCAQVQPEPAEDPDEHEADGASRRVLAVVLDHR